MQVRWKVRQQPREEPTLKPPPKASGAASLRSPGADVGDPRVPCCAQHAVRCTSHALDAVRRMLHGLRRTAGAGKKGMSIVSRMFTSKEGRTDSGGYIHVRLQHATCNMQHGSTPAAVASRM